MFRSVDDYNVCSRCLSAKQQGALRFERRGRALSPRGSGSDYIPSRERWRRIKRDVDNYYMLTTDEEIAEANSNKKYEHKLHKSRKARFRNPGYIYLLKAENGYYKIGRARDMETRMTTIKRQYPIRIDVLHYFACDDYVKAETYLHRQFQDKRMDMTEWFKLNGDEEEWIMSLDAETMSGVLS